MTEAPALRIAPPFLADPTLRPVLAALPEARVVGGAVRDAIAGLPVADVDLATPLPPEQVTRALIAAGLRAVPTGIDHGTVTAVSGGRGFEITTLRRDEATDGRHARVAWTDDWRADAARRDFTINAMSMTPAGEVFDYFDGIADLRAHRVRFVGNAAARIAEDFLRILRFFRFFARYGGAPEAEAVAAIAAGVPGLSLLSAERVWSELKRILAAPDPRASVALMAELGVLAAVLPEGFDRARLDRVIAAGAPSDPLLRLAALLDGDAAALSARLRLANDEAARLLAIRAAPLASPEMDHAALRRLLADTPADALIDRLWLEGGDAGLRARLAATPRPVFPLAGRDAVALGVKPGPQVGRLLRAVRDWWLAGGCVADAHACRTELARRCRG
jgi:poly(A) polymerase/tRNA nucleotidyltransferase (CCA-adding enzyme)